MTAESEAVCQISEFLIEKEKATATSPPTDILTTPVVDAEVGVGGDCRKGGVYEHGGGGGGGDKTEESEQGSVTTINENGVGVNDPDHSYVFVSLKDSQNGGGDSMSDVGNLNVEKEDVVPEPPEAIKGGHCQEILSTKDDCVAAGDSLSDCTAAGHGHSPLLELDNMANKDDDDDATAMPAAITTAAQDVSTFVEPRQPHSSDLKGHGEPSFSSVVEAGMLPPQLNYREEIKLDKQTAATAEAKMGDVLKPHEKIDDPEPILGLEKVEDSQVLIHEAATVSTHDDDDDMDKKLGGEQNLLNSTEHCDDNAEAPDLASESLDLKLSLPNSGSIKVNSEDEVTEMEEPTTAAELGGGNQDFQAVVVSEEDSTECISPKVDVGGDMRSCMEETKMESPAGVKEIPSAQHVMSESEASDSRQMDNLEEKLEEIEDKDNVVRLKDHEEDSQFPVNGKLTADQGSEAAELSIAPNLSLEHENKFKQVLADDEGSCPTAKLEDKGSLAEDLDDDEDPSENANIQDGSSIKGNGLPPADDSVKPEAKTLTKFVGEIFLCPFKAAEVDVEFSEAGNKANEMSNCNEMTAGPDTGFSIELEGKESDSSCAYADMGAEEVSNVMVTDTACGQLPLAGNVVSMCLAANGIAQDGSSSSHMMAKSEVQNSSSANGMDVACTFGDICPTQVQFGSFVPGYQINGESGEDDPENYSCQEIKGSFEQIHINEVVSTPSPEEGLRADPVVEKNVVAVEEYVKRPFNFLIRMPRYDDDELREQIRQAQLQVNEKTQVRDAIKFKMDMLRENELPQLASDYRTAKSEEIAERRLVWLKRQEIDLVQSVINRVKNAISVEDIDIRINHMEHMIQHETLPLKEEKQFVREIKQLKHHREQLSSNMGSQDEVQQALDQRDQIEEQLKILKKELVHLKHQLSTAEAAAKAANLKCKGASLGLKKLHASYKAANAIRQEAYVNMQNLKRQFYEKNAWFRTYKDNSAAANAYASSRDKRALHCLCLNQVEKVMELWNKDDEFRKEYIQCNTRSTLRRLTTLDGRALGPDEESPAVLSSVVDERIEAESHHELDGGGNHAKLLISDLEGGKQQLPPPTEAEITKGVGGDSVENVAPQENELEKAKKLGKPTTLKDSFLSTNSGWVENGGTLEEETHNNDKQTNEKQETGRKEEQLRKEQEEAQLKELRRLEEIAKAKEALERKRKIAEKAQIRAEIRAQKEAEQKEKEKEKRAKKKERKKAGMGGDSSNWEGDITAAAAPTSEFPVVAAKIKEINTRGDVTEVAVNKRPQKAAYVKQYSKAKSTIPPPLRNKNKRRMQHWVWIIVSVVAVLGIVLLFNAGLYPNFAGQNHQMRNHHPGF